MIIAIVGGRGRLGSALYDYLDEKCDRVRVDPRGGDVKSLDELPFSPDVIVDVSCHEQSLASLDYACYNRLPIVIACTGHTKKEIELIRSLAFMVPIFLAYNMASGVQILKETVSFIADRFDGDVHIHEVHHAMKLDSPSGTAKEIDSILRDQGLRPSITSVRAGKIIGEHTVTFYGEGETLEIKHTALSREAFCKGIFEACKLLLDCEPGLFNMANLTGQKSREI